MLSRAYSLLHVKSVDPERRVISGMATTPEVDRVGDVVEPLGATFKNPSPLLLHHDGSRPVGEVNFGRPTKDGIPFTATFPDPETIRSQTLRERVAEAWDSVKLGLIRGVSIGFRALEGGLEVMQSGGLRFTRVEILELSLVSIPANQAATIHTIKSLDSQHLAATGTDGAGSSLHTPGASGTRVVRFTEPTRGVSMTFTEQITALEARRAAQVARRDEIQTKAATEGRTKDESEKQEFDSLSAEIKSIDTELVDLHELERTNRAAARPVVGTSTQAASESRSGAAPVITVHDQKLPPGIGFARAILCKAHARFENQNVLDVAKERYPSHTALHEFLRVKAAVPAGTTTETTWAAPLVYAQNLTSEFISFLMPQTVIGQFGQGGIPALTRVPFNIRVPSQTSAGDAYWVGEGQPKPLTAFGFSTVTLAYNKVAAISVITRELARFSTPSAEQLVRDSLAREIAKRIDTDFLDPAHAVSAGVSPASITNGLSAQTSAGTAAANVITDLSALVAAFVENNYSTASLVLIMPNTLALALSLMTNSLGQPEFPSITVNGGSVKGIPVIASQYAANLSGGGNLVVAVSAKDIFLADDGGVTVDVSQEASLQMLDNPTNASSTGTATTMVSMFQTNSMAIRAEREITWAKARTDCVVYMDDVNWGSIGSPG